MKTKLKVIVEDMLNRIGVPKHLKGYHYLRDAIMMSYNTNNNI